MRTDEERSKGDEAISPARHPVRRSSGGTAETQREVIRRGGYEIVWSGTFRGCFWGELLRLGEYMFECQGTAGAFYDGSSYIWARRYDPNNVVGYTGISYICFGEDLDLDCVEGVLWMHYI